MQCICVVSQEYQKSDYAFDKTTLRLFNRCPIAVAERFLYNESEDYSVALRCNLSVTAFGHLVVLLKGMCRPAGSSG